MKRSLTNTCLAWLAVILAVLLVAIPNVFAQQSTGPGDVQELAKRAQYQEKLQQILNDKVGYATAIVQRWENDARASGKWDENYETEMLAILMKLQPDNLVAAGEAPSYEAMMKVVATGRPAPTILPGQEGAAPLPQVLGSTTGDMVFTPVTPCRIVDTRLAVGPLLAGQTRVLEADNPGGFAAQGGSATDCGIPDDVAWAVAMTITATNTTAVGYFTAWGLGTRPLSSVLNWAPGQTVANTTIVPIVPGPGADWQLYNGNGSVDAVVDVVGYYAAPVATALDCTTVTVTNSAVPIALWTFVTATCPTGRTATGGGYFDTGVTVATYPGIWVMTYPSTNGWTTLVDNQTSATHNITTYVNCCRIPGR